MKKFLAILLLAILAFSGCDLFEKEEEKEEANKTINASTILDDESYKWAVEGENVELCENITDADKKDECKKVVQALILTDEAVVEANKSFCADIKLESYKENCEEVVESKLEQQVLEEEKVAELEENNEKAFKIEEDAVAKKDANICNDIKDENQKYSCRFNILANQALAEKNSKICEGIGSDDYAKTCVETVEGL